MQLFNPNLPFFKGNLHTHTNRSDGALPYEDVLRLYRKNGYDFIAVTDHYIYDEGGYQEGLLKLSGTEIEYTQPDETGGSAFHFVAVDADAGVLDYNRADSVENPQFLINQIKAHGGLAVFCHPAWSLNTTEQGLSLQNYDAIEIMNSVSDPSARGDSSVFCDVLTSKGKKFRTFASDDSHFYNGEQCYSAVYVNAERCDRESIMKALYEGRFFSSTGPKFRNIEIENGKIYVSASPVKTIRFMSNTYYAYDRISRRGFNANEAEYVIKSTDLYVRVELEDENGRRAWSQYIDVSAL